MAYLRRQVIHRETGYVPLLNDFIHPHLKPLPPIKLSYTIRVDEAFHRPSTTTTSQSQSPPPPPATVYDVRVAVDDRLRSRLLPLVHNPAYAATLKDAAALDDALATIVQAVGASRAKHAFLTELARSPASFVRDWLSSQKRDLEVILGEATRGGGEDASGDEWRRGGPDSVWTSRNARESVSAMLAKMPR